MQELSAPQIPNYITARSPLGLRRRMLETNSRARKIFNYYFIQFVDGKWFAWYYDEIESNDELFNPNEENELKAQGRI